MPRSRLAGAPPPSLPAVVPSRRLPILLRRAWYGLNQAFRRRIAHTGCTPDQYTILRNLAEGDRLGLTQVRLTRSMSSDPNTVASLIDRMERLGLVDRAPDPEDRRARRVRLKPLGRKRFVALRKIALDLQAEVLDVLPADARESFLEQLERVADACSTAPRPRARAAVEPEPARSAPALARPVR
jgi:MarR family transcriptional regulator, transcriptional regulator for hemolysin